MSESEKPILSKRLRLLRTANGIKQEELADMLGINRSSYTYYESGRSRPDYDSLITLAKLYHVSIDYLVGMTNMPNNGNRTMQVADDLAEKAASNDAGVPLMPDERYLLGLYRQLSGDAQMMILEEVEKNFPAEDV